MRAPAASSIVIPKQGRGFSGLARRLFRRGGVEGTSGWAGAALEAILLCYAWLAFAVWMTPADPFGLAASFPWVWLMPALVAMRYGSGAGVFSALLILAAWFAFPGYGLSHVDPLAAFPNAYFLGGVALVLVCGQFSDVWNARNRRLRAVNG